MSEELGESFVSWARRESAIRVLVLIGSRARVKNGCGIADEHSDWDFQIITPDVSMFANPSWVAAAGLPAPLAYAKRNGRLNRTEKISAVFSDGELDLILIPTYPLSLAKLMFRLRFGLYYARTDRRLGDLAVVLRAGHSVLKGGPGWERFCATVASQVIEPRLDNATICAIAESFVCDYVSIRQKLSRGELLAAQRWLHCQLGETTFRLLHELRRREGEVSFPDARRIEKLCDRRYAAVTIHAVPEQKSLSFALEKSAETFRELMNALVGQSWHWPQLPSRLRID